MERFPVLPARLPFNTFYYSYLSAEVTFVKKYSLMLRTSPMFFIVYHRKSRENPSHLYLFVWPL